MSLMTFYKGIQCVQIGRHRERPVNIHVRILSGSNLANHTTTLEMTERMREWQYRRRGQRDGCCWLPDTFWGRRWQWQEEEQFLSIWMSGWLGRYGNRWKYSNYGGSSIMYSWSYRNLSLILLNSSLQIRIIFLIHVARHLTITPIKSIHEYSWIFITGDKESCWEVHYSLEDNEERVNHEGERNSPHVIHHYEDC